jgi:hypothetical protein
MKVEVWSSVTECSADSKMDSLSWSRVAIGEAQGTVQKPRGRRTSAVGSLKNCYQATAVKM